jgi:uncharacterized protein YeaO (DUF488 family)
MIFTSRVYNKSERTGGSVFLVDRIWPRGIKKEDLHIDGWMKESSPSSDLRKWFHRNPERWIEFKKQYFKELDDKPQAWKSVLEASLSGDVTLLYGSKDTEHNNAVALKEYLEGKLKHQDKT